MDTNQNENQILGEMLQIGVNKPFISRVTISKVANLGNYENRKIEISVSFGKAEDVGEIYSQLEQIIDDINCTNGAGGFELRQSQKYLSMPPEELSDFDRERLPFHQQRVDDYQALLARRSAAIEKLNQFGGVSEFKDAKDDWEDED